MHTCGKRGIAGETSKGGDLRVRRRKEGDLRDVEEVNVVVDVEEGVVRLSM